MGVNGNSLCLGSCTRVFICQNSSGYVTYKGVHLIAYKFYFNKVDLKMKNRKFPGLVVRIPGFHYCGIPEFNPKLGN